MFKVARQVRKRGGYFALFSHISTLLFGNSRFINSCSTIDLKDANISFAEDLSGFIQYLIPNCNFIEIQKALKLSDQLIRPILNENEAYPHGWNSGLMLRKLIFIIILVHGRRFELPHPCGRYHLKVVRLPFRHLRIP